MNRRGLLKSFMASIFGWFGFKDEEKIISDFPPQIDDFIICRLIVDEPVLHEDGNFSERWELKWKEIYVRDRSRKWISKISDRLLNSHPVKLPHPFYKEGCVGRWIPEAVFMNQTPVGWEICLTGKLKKA